GTGKSTLLSAIAGLLTDAEATFEVTASGLATRPMAYLSQHPVFVSKTVAEELAMVAEGTVVEYVPERSATNIAELIGIALEHSGLPDTQLRYIDNLSPGEDRKSVV